MIALLDVNFLIALAWPSHIHHADAHRWFSRHASRGWATCPLTELGFLRISSNSKIIPEAVSPQEALEWLKKITTQGRHVFWQDKISLHHSPRLTKRLMGHRQVTDLYLLALAIHYKGKLVTFDKAILTLLATQEQNSVIELLASN